MHPRVQCSVCKHGENMYIKTMGSRTIICACASTPLAGLTSYKLWSSWLTSPETNAKCWVRLPLCQWWLTCLSRVLMFIDRYLVRKKKKKKLFCLDWYFWLATEASDQFVDRNRFLIMLSLMVWNVFCCTTGWGSHGPTEELHHWAICRPWAGEQQCAGVNYHNVTCIIM